MADPYSKAIIQNGLQQRLLCQATRQIDCKRRKALNQIWFDRREIYRDLVCIRTKTPSLSAKSSVSSQGSVSTTEADGVDSSIQSLSSSMCSTSSDLSNLSLATDTSNLQSPRKEKRTKPKQRRKSVTLTPKIVKRIAEVNSIHLNLERLSIAIEQRQHVIAEQKLEKELKVMAAAKVEPTSTENGAGEQNQDGENLDPIDTAKERPSREVERNTTGLRDKRSLSS